MDLFLNKYVEGKASPDYLYAQAVSLGWHGLVQQLVLSVPL